MIDEKDNEMMLIAYNEAQKSINEGGLPIGSVLTENGNFKSKGHNQRVQNGNPIAHGEMDCLMNAGRMSTYKNTTLYTTLSPCMMCSGTIVQFKIPRVVIGENVTFEGNIEFLRQNGVVVELMNDDKCIKMMSEFISKNPSLWNEDIGEL